MPRTAEGSATARGARLGGRPARGSRVGEMSAPAAGLAYLDRRKAMGRTLWALVGLGVIWRVARYAAGPPLWGDEAFLAVSLLTRDFRGLLRPLDYYQIAPAGFLWMVHAVTLALGRSEWSLRLIPFASGLASLGLFVGFARKAVDRRSALLAVGIFAASFYPVRHATEVKPYATDLLFSLGTTALAWRTWLDRESAGRWLALTGWVAVGVWCSYPLVFVAAGIGVVLAVRVARAPTVRASACFLGFGLVAASSWLGSYFAVAREQAKAAPFYTSLGTWKGAFPPLGRPWEMASWLLDVHTGNMLAYPNGGNSFGSLATATLVAVGALAMLRRRPALLALLLAPLVPTLLAATLKLYPYGTSARTTLFMAPAFCLLAGVGAVALVRQLGGVRRRRAYRLATLTLVAMMVVPTVVNVAWPYKNYEDGENRRAVADLAALARPGDRWIVYDGVARLPISSRLMLEHWLQQMAEVRYNVLARGPVPVDWLPASGGYEVAEAGRTWLIVHRSGCPKFDREGLARLQEDLAGRLGPPRARVDELTRGEAIESFEYPAAGGGG